MEVLQNFKNLFFDVWNKGISGINISEIIIALLIFLFFLFLRGVFSKFVVKRLENYVSINYDFLNRKRRPIKDWVQRKWKQTGVQISLKPSTVQCSEPVIFFDWCIYQFWICVNKAFVLISNVLILEIDNRGLLVIHYLPQRIFILSEYWA